jgi:hypothetical protein
MVWKPSEQTQSPYEPLWEMHVGFKNWYIDQKGKVYARIIESEEKKFQKEATDGMKVYECIKCNNKTHQADSICVVCRSNIPQMSA